MEVLARPEIRLNLLAIFRAYAPLTITTGHFSEYSMAAANTGAKKKAAGPKPRRSIRLAMSAAI
jgi:hypothetical protein